MKVTLVGGHVTAIAESISDIRNLLRFSSQVGRPVGPSNSTPAQPKRRKHAPISYRKPCANCEKLVKTRGMKLHYYMMHKGVTVPAEQTSPEVLN